MRTWGWATAIGLIAASGSAANGRPVNDAERTKLSAAVYAAGCTGGTLQYDDGAFGADGVICVDGKKYGLKFDAAFKLIQKRQED